MHKRDECLEKKQKKDEDMAAAIAALKLADYIMCGCVYDCLSIKSVLVIYW